MIPTQFGHIPDIAFEEIKQLRAQQSQVQQPGSLPYATSTFGGSASASASNPSAQGPAPLVEPVSNGNRLNGRDLSVNHLNGIVRSRSLASNSTSRPAVAPASSNANSSAYQPSLFPSNKSTYLPPTRYGLNRLVSGPANGNPPLPSSSAMSYASNRSLPISTQPNIKPRPGNHHHHHGSTTVNPDPQRPHYETTYRSSFIKPLAP